MIAHQPPVPRVVQPAGHLVRGERETVFARGLDADLTLRRSVDPDVALGVGDPLRVEQRRVRRGSLDDGEHMAGEAVDDLALAGCVGQHGDTVPAVGVDGEVRAVSDHPAGVRQPGAAVDHFHVHAERVAGTDRVGRHRDDLSETLGTYDPGAVQGAPAQQHAGEQAQVRSGCQHVPIGRRILEEAGRRERGRRQRRAVVAQEPVPGGEFGDVLVSDPRRRVAHAQGPQQPSGHGVRQRLPRHLLDDQPQQVVALVGVVEQLTWFGPGPRIA